MIMSMLKQLKKKLRRKVKWISLGISALLVIPVLLYWSGSDKSQSVFEPVASDEPLSWEVSNQAVLGNLTKLKQSKEVVIQKTFVCGEELQRIGTRTPGEIAKLVKEHPAWRLSIQGEDQVYLTEHIQDLSASCKEAAYFGVDESGVLSLFDGIPMQNKVIQSFFQLNIPYLKSALPPETVAQLFAGIRVTDIDEYNSVLSTFADYARAGADQLAGSSKAEGQ
ncbi:hypothetical protein E0485_18415 [Paenibacillus albiflavus]|uniref:Bypass of forespore C C-terminal domain-containing protein n=1 Tax=Paenibacillus albiflavus TaxID=2545760 RepID=A0A4R4E623_9BACL|nr:BofC C-terminal domain-containing protein [Paenibacillus albiflavus]TCZ75124.1 hypothetical protein E0485_18415 [Paenibacillus albiflavus]